MLASEYIDYYALLNLPPHATVDEIRRAYRKKVMDCHPDLYPDDPDKLRLFNTVKEAYETLIHPQKKRDLFTGKMAAKGGRTIAR